MTDFTFDELTIDRMIAHTIFARGKDKEKKAPSTSDQLIPLNPESRDLVQARITEALASKAHGIEAQIQRTEPVSFMQRAALMQRHTDDEYIAASKVLADALADAQTNPRWPGGVLIVLSGKVGTAQKPYIAVIKAETDKGFNIVEKDGSVSLDLIKKMLLSQTQRLYKIGMLVEVNYEAPTSEGHAAANYRAFLFDHLLTTTETKDAAAYFYDAFLGMTILGSSKHQTREFYERSKAYINALPAQPVEKTAMLEALRTELRNNKATVSVAGFAADHMPKEYAKEYVREMTKQGVPQKAIVKDLNYIKSKLRRPRKVVFTTGVNIQVPPDKDLKEHVEISAQKNGYTTVKIKGVVQAQD